MPTPSKLVMQERYITEAERNYGYMSDEDQYGKQAVGAIIEALYELLDMLEPQLHPERAP